MVLHFLMLRACPAEMPQAFKLLWPVVDAAQGREFRKVHSAATVQARADQHWPGRLCPGQDRVCVMGAIPRALSGGD